MTEKETCSIECKHYKDTPHGTIDCVNPYSGECQKCGKQVKKGITDKMIEDVFIYGVSINNLSPREFYKKPSLLQRSRQILRRLLSMVRWLKFPKR